MSYPVRYKLNGRECAFRAEAPDDLGALASAIEEQMKGHDPALADDPYLRARLIDRLVMTLVDDPTEIDLGDFSATR